MYSENILSWLSFKFVNLGTYSSFLRSSKSIFTASVEVCSKTIFLSQVSRLKSFNRWTDSKDISVVAKLKKSVFTAWIKNWGNTICSASAVNISFISNLDTFFIISAGVSSLSLSKFSTASLYFEASFNAVLRTSSVFWLPYSVLHSSFTESGSTLSKSSVPRSSQETGVACSSSLKVFTTDVENKSGVCGTDFGIISSWTVLSLAKKSFELNPDLFRLSTMPVSVRWKSAEQVNTYDKLRNSQLCFLVYGWRSTRPSICSTDIREVLFANDAKI